MQAINRQTVGDKFRAYLKHPGSLILFALVMLAALVTFAVLVFLIAYKRRSVSDAVPVCAGVQFG